MPFGKASGKSLAEHYSSAAAAAESWFAHQLQPRLDLREKRLDFGALGASYSCEAISAVQAAKAISFQYRNYGAFHTERFPGAACRRRKSASSD